MSDDGETTVPIECRACETETEVPLRDLPEVLVEHNERRHDGESIAQVDPALADGIADLAAEDLGLVD
jgi:hypothetical protein